LESDKYCFFTRISAFAADRHPGCDAESEKKDLMTKNGGQKISNQRGRYSRTHRRHLFYFFVIPFFCHSLVAGLT
jgi:hypothetical protein